MPTKQRRVRTKQTQKVEKAQPNEIAKLQTIAIARGPKAQISLSTQIPKLERALSMPSKFRFGEVSSLILPKFPLPSVPSLGPLAAFSGTFSGTGFNTIFRPDSTAT